MRESFILFKLIYREQVCEILNQDSLPTLKHAYFLNHKHMILDMIVND